VVSGERLREIILQVAIVAGSDPDPDVVAASIVDNTDPDDYRELLLAAIAELTPVAVSDFWKWNAELEGRPRLLRWLRRAV
jgi:hypothetical protein